MVTNSCGKFNSDCNSDVENGTPGGKFLPLAHDPGHTCSTGNGCCVYLRKNSKTCSLLLGILIVALLVVIVLIQIYSPTPKQKDMITAGYQETVNSPTTVQNISTTELTETLPYQPQEEYIRLNVTNSDITSYSGTSSPVLVFKSSGRYTITLLVVFDEDYCRHNSPPEGKIHLRIEKADDHSKVGKVFSETFFRRADRKWVIYGRINTEVWMHRGHGLLIYTDHRECIKQTDTYLRVTKLKNKKFND